MLCTKLQASYSPASIGRLKATITYSNIIGVKDNSSASLLQLNESLMPRSYQYSWHLWSSHFILLFSAFILDIYFDAESSKEKHTNSYIPKEKYWLFSALRPNHFEKGILGKKEKTLGFLKTGASSAHQSVLRVRRRLQRSTLSSFAAVVAQRKK